MDTGCGGFVPGTIAIFTGTPPGAVKKNANTSLISSTNSLYSSDENTYWNEMFGLVGTKSNSSMAASWVLSAPDRVVRSASPGCTLSTEIPVSPSSFPAGATPETQFGPTTLRTDPELSTIPLVNPRIFVPLVKFPAARADPV